MALAKAQLMQAPGGPGILGAVTAGTGIEINNGVISATGGGGTATSVAVTPIPGISQATNVQSALEAIELQVQDRIEFCNVTGVGGLQASVSAPISSSNDGTTLTLTTLQAGVSQAGVVQLTNELDGNSQSLALTQFGANQLNSKVDALIGANVLAGTYNAATGTVSTVTPAGALYFTVGQQAPAATSVPDNYYLLVTIAGNSGPPGAVIPPTGVQSGDWFVVEREAGVASAWVTIDFQNNAVAAVNVSLSNVSGLSATNVQDGIQQLETKAENSVTSITASASDGLTVTLTPAGANGRTANLTLGPATATDLGGVFVQPGLGINLAPNGAISLAPPARVDDISSQFNNTAFEFNLISNSQPITPLTNESILVVLGGIVQIPGDNYTVAANKITFTSPPAAGTTFYSVVFVQG